MNTSTAHDNWWPNLIVELHWQVPQTKCYDGIDVKSNTTNMKVPVFTSWLLTTR